MERAVSGFIMAGFMKYGPPLLDNDGPTGRFHDVSVARICVRRIESYVGRPVSGTGLM